MFVASNAQYALGRWWARGPLLAGDGRRRGRVPHGGRASRRHRHRRSGQERLHRRCETLSMLPPTIARVGGQTYQSQFVFPLKSSC